MSPLAQRAQRRGGPCPAAGSPAAKSPPETVGGRDQDRQAEEETMAELTAGATAHLEPPLPSYTPSPPTGLGSASRQDTSAGSPTAPVWVRPTRRAEVQETPRDEAAAVAVERGSVAAATASVEVVGEVAAAAEVPAEAVTTLGRAGGTAAAFGGGSTSLSANHQGAQLQTLELGPAVDLEPSEAVALSASPAPVPAAVLAAAMTAATAAGNQADAPVEGEVPVAAVSAGTSAAAEGADTQERDQAASGRRGHGTVAPVHAARGKGGRRLRAQPAPRRPGAGLGPGAPGPLRGWSEQEESPLTPERQPPSVGQEREEGDEEADVRHVAGHISPEAGTTRGPQRETRSSTRPQGITWGRPRLGLARQTHSPWIPAGRAPQAGRGGRNDESRTGEGAPIRGAQGGGRGARGGRRGGGAIVGGREALVRSGTWRERHDRPEQEAPPTNQEERDTGNGEDGGDYVAETPETSEEISLEAEGDTTGRERGRRAIGRHPQDRNLGGGNPQDRNPGARNPQEGNHHERGEIGAVTSESQRETGQPTVQSPAELVANEAIWQQAATWEVAPLQRGDQPFLVRRMPPKILESYTLCVLAPLLRLQKNPDCPGAWVILQFLPRLTLRPLPEPVQGSRWVGIEGRLHRFQQGSWAKLFEEAKVIPDTENPSRHQADAAGLCARAEGLMKKGNISKAVAALRATPLAETTPATLAALRAKHPDAASPPARFVSGYTHSELRVTPDDLRELLKRCPNGVGAGPSGTCFEHLKDPALASEEVLILLAQIISYLLSTFQSQAVRDLLLPSRLIALEKPGGGVRPIAMGEAILRVVAKAALRELAQTIREYFLPVQFGVAVTGGAECIVHSVRSLLQEDESRVALQLDIENAFNSVERPAFFQALSQSSLLSLLPLVRTLYDGPAWP
ncbi:unnamed protein product [Closterium sp. Naga37s-1]|nr:unnamed protein product [Closterium sp. Naga37s-1]